MNVFNSVIQLVDPNATTTTSIDSVSGWPVPVPVSLRLWITIDTMLACKMYTGVCIVWRWYGYIMSIPPYSTFSSIHLPSCWWGPMLSTESWGLRYWRNLIWHLLWCTSCTRQDLSNSLPDLLPILSKIFHACILNGNCTTSRFGTSTFKSASVVLPWSWTDRVPQFSSLPSVTATLLLLLPS